MATHETLWHSNSDDVLYCFDASNRSGSSTVTNLINSSFVGLMSFLTRSSARKEIAILDMRRSLHKIKMFQVYMIHHG